MRSLALLPAWLLCLSLLSLSLRAEEAPVAPVADARLVRVVLQTSLGDIHLELDPVRAPLTTANFLRYVDEKRYDGATFYRALKLDDEGNYGLVQGGVYDNPQRLLPPIAHEAPAATGLGHKDGAISMANRGAGTARSDFFLIIGDLESLDGKGTDDDPGYAVFGRVSAGMEVVRAINELPRDPEAGEGSMKGQMLAERVRIVAARRAE